MDLLKNQIQSPKQCGPRLTLDVCKVFNSTVKINFVSFIIDNNKYSGHP